ncbi:Myb-like_DNA-binding domain-containing protein [Hexamita inflata]|uniref:Myb-like DNA-binding domain-containing protein n=1 Tax=Hexamita inflata TaxID=28002 RepID=A0AA86UBR2_9EUKA|nr:Myb-like DNA-binding domain-containing protein [Hexamita inflata]
MSKIKQQWAPEEIDKLIQLTQNNRDSKRDINWKLISSQMKNRTELQCKSYYQNILKKKLSTTMRKNHTWNRIELMMLFTQVYQHEGNFEVIQQNMPNFTIQQLKSQWIQMKSKLNQYIDDYKLVLQNQSYIQHIPTKLLIQEEYMIRVGLVRKYHILNNTVDEIYVQQYKQFWKTLDPSQIFDIYHQEFIRRNIEKPVFVVTDPENLLMF